MSDADSLTQLCDELGILRSYRDALGTDKRVPETTLRALIDRLRISTRDDLLPRVSVHRWGEPIAIAVGPHALGLQWTIGDRSGSVTGDRLTIEQPLETGYHDLVLRREGIVVAQCTLAVAPRRAFQPQALRNGGRLWGLATQLFALRSERNWGIGDFTDLGNLIELAAAHGVAAIGLTPLHALFPDEPDRCSPYSPSSRTFLNTLYIDPEALPEFATSEAAQKLVSEPGFRAELERLRSTALVDYAGVAACKQRIFPILYRHFQDRHLARDDTQADAFNAFRASCKNLRLFATFEALRAHFAATGEAGLSWHTWPAAYRDPLSPQVAAFAATHEDQIAYVEYLQWHAHQQLARCQKHARAMGMPIGVYLDIAVGVDGDSAEAWWSQDYLVSGWSIGAPPDNWNLKGQSWGAPPPNPTRMRERAYGPIREFLEANMRPAGAVRIDHILGLMRLFWVPVGADAADGAYVHYALQDLLAIVALESERHRCLVIGEDLGTVPDGVREALQDAGILCYRLLYFEQEGDGRFRKPADWLPQALAAPSTHDLATLPAFWQGKDLDLRRQLDLYPSADIAVSERQRRAADRGNLVAALAAESLTADEAGEAPIEAIYRFLARTRSCLLMVQPEDLLGVVDPQNVPGTTTEYPNWRRKLPLALDALFADPRVSRMAAAINDEGRAPSPARAIPDAPIATYRLQFSRAFTFADATRLIPYLRDLGISHVYASSYLKARPGSAHGYDITDHNALNPEIGTPEEFEQFCGALRKAGMGQILDFIPNHMGIGHADNAMWLDVLEWGEASPSARFFDINWRPRQLNLQGKVLLPMLGRHYGLVLEAGELQLKFDGETGSFSVWYFEHRFPIHPRCYTEILCDTGIRLPPMDDREAATRTKRALVELAGEPEARHRIAAAVTRINGQAGRPESFHALHALLEQQAYRLAFWRVAADEINYRRFFDINELAGIRMEDAEVFNQTHALIAEWIGAGLLQGLRLDHIDGLLDPAAYLSRLRTLAGTQAKPFHIVTEKILAHHERLRPDWPIDGTTGYEFINLINGLFVDPAGRAPLDRTYRRFLDRSSDFDEILEISKKLVMDTMLANELNRLAAALDAISERHWSTRDYTEQRLRDALREIVASFPVYRTYVTERGISTEDRRDIDWAVSKARKTYAGPDPEILDFVHAALTVDLVNWNPAFDRDEVLQFAMRFQQYTGPVTAKALEDTSFYRFNRLISLNEVGGDPRQFGVSVAAFHHLMQDRAKQWPLALSPLSTHDTKRGADMRARINVLSELPQDWNQRVRRWASLNRYKRGTVDDFAAPSPNDEYGIYQTMLGAWPAEMPGEAAPDAAATEAFRKRLQGIVLKSIREAKRRTSWANPNEAYETACLTFVERILELERANPFLEDFLLFQGKVARFGMLNSLSQLVLTLTAPGVPDIYQGCELWDLNMVDPDNRRPVDFTRRIEFLRAPSNPIPDVMSHWRDGRIKLAVLRRLLQCRQAHAELFRFGSYEPLRIEGTQSDHVVGYVRRHERAICIVVAGRMFVRLASEDGARFRWGDAATTLPNGSLPLRCVLSDRIATPGEHMEIGALLDRLPATVLIGEA